MVGSDQTSLHSYLTLSPSCFRSTVFYDIYSLDTCRRVRMDPGLEDVSSTEVAPTACFRTFSTFELLEAILLQLPCSLHTLAIKRVCRYWRDTFDESYQLQVAFCLTSIDSSNSQPADLTPNLSLLSVADVVEPRRGTWEAAVVLKQLSSREVYRRMQESRKRNEIIINPVLHDLFPEYAYRHSSSQRYLVRVLHNRAHYS